MLESELNDRQLNDNADGGRGAEDLSPVVPAAVFQPPPVVFQPPVRPEHEQAAQASGPASTPSAPPPRAEPDGPGGDDDDGAGSGRRRRRRPTRGRARGADQETTDEGGDAQAEAEAKTQESPEPPTPPEPQRDGQQTSRSRSRNRKSAQAKEAAAEEAAGVGREGKDGAETGPEPAAATADGAEFDDADSGDRQDGAGRRRRRKRRRGSAEGGPDQLAPDDPPDTVVHVRESNGNDDVRSVKGSTRLEAKKQRRREGRETGRRRPPVITESEFLARRESVERGMVVRQRKDRTQIAVLEDGVLVEHYVNRSSHQSYVGNVYLGKVQNVLPSMEAAFVDIGKGRNAVLYAGEVNFDVSGLEGQPKRIESALKPGQSVIVQVTKDPVGHKGARLTSQVSLPGRYLVYVPGASMTGISRKLPDTERNRLKQILKKVMPEHAGVIVRTAAEGAAEEELSRDVSRLAAQWETIEKKAKTASAPALLYSEPDLTIRVIRDVFNEDFGTLMVSGDEAWDTVDEYVKYVAPHLADRVSRWQTARDVFGEYRIDEQLAKALERKVWLPSGGSLVIDKTEAMTVIDVNTGKFTGQGGNLEETVTRNNLEAAEEIVRQLRLRDVGGIVVIDFIDMVLESNRELVLRRLLECLARDRTKHQVAEVTSLGLVQMTRKRVGAGLLEAFSTPCECCNGRGVILTFEPDGDTQSTHHVHSRGQSGTGGTGRKAAAMASPAAVAGSGAASGSGAVAGSGAASGSGAAVSPGAVAGSGAAANPAAVITRAQQSDGSDAQQPTAPQPETTGAAQPENGHGTGGQGESGRPSGPRRRRRKPAASAASPPPAAPPPAPEPQAAHDGAA